MPGNMEAKQMSRLKVANSYDEALKTLISQISSIELEDENFEQCYKFALSHFKYHRFLSVDSHSITRKLDGICTKFAVHSQSDKAETLKQLVEKFLSSPLSGNTSQPKTDAHYGVLSILLELADCPTEQVFKKKQLTLKVPEPEFDWSSYLLEGEREHRSYYYSDSDDEAEEDDDIDNNQSEIETETLINETENLIGPHDGAKEWLLNNLVVRYWREEGQENNVIGVFLSSNLHKAWENHQIENNPCHVSRTSFITEPQLLREILWMLSGIKNNYIFMFDGKNFYINQVVYLSHLTEKCMETYLEKFMKYGSQVVILKSFCHDVHEDCCNFMSSQPVYTQTYQAFIGTLYTFFKEYQQFLTGKEIEVRDQEKSMTLSILSNDLEEWFEKVDLVYSIYISGVEAASELDSKILKTSHLLNIMFKTLIEHDTLGDFNQHKRSMLLVMWIETCRPYLGILSDWITTGNLIDPREDFVLQRNKTAQCFDETFWENAFILRLANKTDGISDSTTTRQDAETSDATTIPRFLKPVLKQIALTGKSIELLISMGKADNVQKIDGFGQKQKSLYEIFIANLIDMLGLKTSAEKTTPGKVTRLSNLDQKINNGILAVNGVWDPLLKINFDVLFDHVKLADILHRGQYERDLNLLRSLEYQTFQPLEIILQRCLYPYIHHRYNEVCVELVNIIKNHFHLLPELKAARGFFLMEAGDTMFDFYSQLFDKIKRNEDWRDEAILGFLLEEALESKFSQSANRLSVEVEPPSSEDINPISLTNCIKLNYQVPWPVNMIISKKYQDKYNEIFTFLLQIKRAKYALEQINFKDLDRIDLSKSFGSEEETTESEDPTRVKIHRLQMLRFRLLYFINSLHNYIMTGILHSTSLELERQLHKAVDLDQIITTHVNYIQKIHHHCLLDPSLATLKTVISEVLNQILIFQNYWQLGVNDISTSAIDKMQKEFSRCVQFLASFLNSVIKRGSFPQLESLAFAMTTTMGKV